MRVEWAGDVVEDRVYRRRAVRIGAGGRAHTVAPGPTDRLITLRRRRRGYMLDVPSGVARRIAVTGEGVAAPAEPGGYRRWLAPSGPYPSAVRLEVGDAAVLVEAIALVHEPRDVALWAWAAVAALVALAGAGRLAVHLVETPARDWAQPIAAAEASRLRVKLDPHPSGAPRPQPGAGVALRGQRHADATRRTTAATPQAARTQAPAPMATLERLAPRAARTRRVATRAPSGSGPVTPAPAAPVRGRRALAEAAEAALLTADLRGAIEGFSRAAESGPLDYDELNWLGLAHYMLRHYDDAADTWQRARTLDPGRPEAINNLASVAKRRGDDVRERELLDDVLAQREDCHASNSMALVLAKTHARERALAMLERSDAACGGNYPYTDIQRAGLLALDGAGPAAWRSLEAGLSRLDAMVPIKEYEVYADLTLDPAFASLRADPRFPALVQKYLPRAATHAAEPSGPATAPAALESSRPSTSPTAQGRLEVAP